MPKSYDPEWEEKTAHERLESAKRVMFWSDEKPPVPQTSFQLSAEASGDDLHFSMHEAVAILRAPEVTLGYRGSAACRICNKMLGSHDFIGYGCVWPERAEHYVVAHNIITPELVDLVRFFREWIRAKDGI